MAKEIQLTIKIDADAIGADIAEQVHKQVNPWLKDNLSNDNLSMALGALSTVSFIDALYYQKKAGADDDQVMDWLSRYCAQIYSAAEGLHLKPFLIAAQVIDRFLEEFKSGGAISISSLNELSGKLGALVEEIMKRTKKEKKDAGESGSDSSGGDNDSSTDSVRDDSVQ